MAPAEKAIQLRRLVKSAKFWFILLMLVALSILHYAEQLGIIGTTHPSYHFGLTRHTVDRILLLVPIIYAGFNFRLRAGLAICFIALLIMLPRALFISPTPLDALLESGGILLTGVLVCLWFEAQRKVKEQRQQATMELEGVQQELQSYIRLSRSNEKRLATLNAVSNMLSRSFELEEVLHSALNMVVEVMEVEVALIFFLAEETGELRLIAYEGVSDKFAQGVDRMKLGEGFNGRVAVTGQPLIVENASLDPRLSREVVRQEKIEALLTVPLKATGSIIGTLCVANRRPRQFLAEEIELLSTIGGQIGITMENARFYREQQRMQENLRFYLQQVTRAQEEERKRIARELHDETTQSLVAISHQLENFASNSKHLSADDIELLNNLRQQAKSALEGIRHFSGELRLPVLDDLGLLPALEWLTDNLKEKYGIKIELKVIGSQRRPAPEAEILIFRIVQEATNNAGRHAEASLVEVTVEFDEDKIVATVRDDGKGFELPRTLGELSRVGKLGLAGAEERARLLGGSLTVQSKPGKGTTVVLNAPV